MIKVGRSLSQLVGFKGKHDPKSDESVSGRGGTQAYRGKSFFQGIRKSLKGDKPDAYPGAKGSHISITPKPAITIQPPKKVSYSSLDARCIPSFSFYTKCHSSTVAGVESDCWNPLVRGG